VIVVELGPHAVFIWASYVVVAVVIAGLVAWLTIDGRRHQRQLGELEAQGVRRRSREAAEGAHKPESAE
jgi:heme exporter protein D